MSEITLKDVVVRIDDKNILNGIDATIKSKTLTCLLGPNGAGKTTLIKTISNLINFNGEITINGHSIKNFTAREIAKQIAYVPQVINNEIPFTLKEFLEFSHYPWYFEERVFNKEVFEEIVSLTGLIDKLGQSMKTLSGGEQQRAMIAAALLQNTPVILFDEITSALDPKYQEQILQIILRIKTKGKTLIWSTHDINAALFYGDAIVAIKDAKVFKIGTGEQFLKENIFKLLYEREFKKGILVENQREFLI